MVRWDGLYHDDAHRKGDRIHDHFGVSWLPTCIKTTSDREMVNKITLVLCFMIIWLPTQYPWYFTWLIPWLVLRPQASFLLYAALLPAYYFRYHFMVRGEKEIFDVYLVWLEHIPAYGVIAWEWYRGRWSPKSKIDSLI